jgi:hypothetical protein
MLWLMFAVALLMVGIASFGPAGGLRKRTRGRRKKAA